MNKLLIVDDNEDIRKQLKWGLGRDGFTLLFAADVAEALALFKKHKPPVVTLDLGLPPHTDSSEEGLRCLGEMLRVNPATKVIVITGNEERENALTAIQNGAYDFYKKPIDLNELRVIIARAFHLATLEAENKQMQSELRASIDELGGIIGQCAEMQSVFSTVRKVAASDVAVLISGESGTGKELVAKAIHAKSLRKDGPFIPINCGAIPENLLEAELFGHEKGAFTGALSRVQGKVEYAHQGTLFLDEIGEMPPNLQVKLLRFLQEKTIQRVGGRETIPVDVRIVSATNINIAEAIAAGSFREDFYYRIGVVTVALPPLSRRGDDILLLANYFLHRIAGEMRKKVAGFSHEAIEVIRRYEWPGNVRELENKVHRAVIMCTESSIAPADLGFEDRGDAQRSLSFDDMTLREARDLVERNMIEHAIRSNEGNIAKAASILGISRPTMYDLLRKHGVS